MIIVKLSGGLGNQMFQYAASRSLALRNNDILKFDLSWFKNLGDTNRYFKLYVFNIINIAEATEEEIRNLKPTRLLRFLKLYNQQMYFKEKYFNFDPEILKLKGDIYLDGYWQSEKYFKDFDSVIRQEFNLKNPISVEAQNISLKIISDNSVSIHVRRGDYVSSPKTFAYHGVCSLPYYKQAIDIMKGKLKNPVFYIFSDDMQWVKEKLKIDGDIVYVSRLEIKDYEEMILMSQCKNNIIANSSFSWWAGWLNKDHQKIVIAPQKWFNLQKNIKDLIPEKWICI